MSGARGPWTHSLCVPCATSRGMFDPYTYIIESCPADRCCACGVEHSSGIYVRESPDSAGWLCKGQHPMPAPQHSFPEPKPKWMMVDGRVTCVAQHMHTPEAGCFNPPPEVKS